MEKRFKLGRSINNDQIIMVSLLFVSISLIFLVIVNTLGFIPNFKNPGRGPITKEDGGSIFFYIALICCLIFIPIVIIRLNRIRAIIRDGEIVIGRIVSIEFIKDRGRISVEYNYDEKEYKRSIGVMKTKRTKAIKSGDEKELIINKYKPTQLLISDLYCE